MANQTTDPLLDLNDLIEGPSVRLDGTNYELLTWAQLPPLDSSRVKRFSTRVAELVDQETLTEKEEQELEALPNRIVRLVLDAPEQVLASLTDRQRMRIIRTFMAPLRQTLTAEGMAEQSGITLEPSPSGGESSSPGSVASTAALP